MKIVNLTLGASMFMASIGPLLADNSFSVSMDKGELIISYDSSLDQKYTIKSIVPTECEPGTKVNVAESQGSVSILHAGENCSRGATVKLVIGKEVGEFKARLKSGVLTLQDSVTQHSQKVEATVSAGLIQSRKLDIRVMNNYAGQKGSMAQNGDDKSLTVNVLVDAGIIKTH